ncbi:MAG: hypothetical protein ACJAYU_004960 [Bradymonadia bacterium]|jgi:hypothetical protein
MFWKVENERRPGVVTDKALSDESAFPGFQLSR